jgi:hypothetical protein
MPARVTARVHITVSAHDALHLLERAVFFLRVCYTNPLTLMHICPDNAVQLSHLCCEDAKRVAVLEKISCIDGDQALLYKCPVEVTQVPRRCFTDSEKFVSNCSDATCGGVRC